MRSIDIINTNVGDKKVLGLIIKSQWQQEEIAS